MILESLLELVKTLKERIEKHDDQLRKSEWLTRYALVDPLLRELGWDTEDPTLVIPEYQSGHGRADYALLGDGKPVMMVEAKKLGTQLQDSVLSQGINYCLMEGTNYFTVTDGQRWEVYETHKAVPIDQKRVVEFDIGHLSAADACLKALALWRPSVQSGSVAPGTESVLGLTEDDSNDKDTTDQTEISEDDDREWMQLTQVNTANYEKPPVELRCPDGSLVSITYWYGLITEPTRWLLNKGHLTPSHLPIQKASKYLVSTTATHPNEALMVNGKDVSGTWVETAFAKSGCVKNATTIIEHVGQDPSQFSVRFS